jgi:hypothetical protein
LDGAATYARLPDGRWRLQAGDVGTRDIFHPAWALEALGTCCIAALAGDHGRIEVQLDPVGLSRLARDGSAQEWNTSAAVTVHQDRIAEAQIRWVAPDDPREAIHLAVQIDPVAAPISIDLPASTATVTFSDYLGEQR